LIDLTFNIQFVYRMVDGMVRDPATSFLVGQNTSFNATGLDLPVASQALTQSAQSAQLRAMGYDESDVKQVGTFHIAVTNFDFLGLVDSFFFSPEDRQKQQQKSNYWFELHPDPKRVELVRRRCNDIQYPMLEEYEFRKDNAAALDLRIQLKPSASHRDYQVKALSKMFGNGRARSGIIVLPCGAGKTLTGITAATTIKKNTLVLATTNMAANQWKREFEKWTAVDPRDVVVFTSDNVEDITNRNPIVLISTYSMISFHGQRAIRTAEVIRDIKTREWGLVLLDEVHVVPANTFRECIGSTHSRCKLGLTATLVREDNLIEDLFFLIGPKLYEANWQDLSREGYLAKVQWCGLLLIFLFCRVLSF
jgi:DNA excision repair protein ERCC-3